MASKKIVENKPVVEDVENLEAEKCEIDVNETVELTEIETLKLEIEKANNYALRTKADLENVKKRNFNIASEMFIEGKMETLLKVLPVIDSFDRALSMENVEKEGLLAIKKQFDSILEKLGVEEIKSEGEIFDPRFHNAMMQVEDEANSGKVVQVYEKGYKLAEKVLRHASVVVAK